MKNFEFEHNGQKYWHSRSVAVLGIVTAMKDNELFVVITKRGPNTPDNQGKWCMPCGYLDFGETVEQAVSREVFEETGLGIDPSQFKLDMVHSIATDKQNVTIHFRFHLNMYMTTDSNIFNSITTKYADEGEVDEVKWISIFDLKNYEWAFNHDEIIKSLLTFK